MDEFKLEQPVAYKVLTNAIKHNRFSHAYLIETNSYQKKDKFILSFIKYVLCPDHHLNGETCIYCEKIESGNHSEVKYINSDGLTIKKEQLINLKKEMSLKSIEGQLKIYVINEAEKLNDSSANTLLKFLEEPEPNILAILVADNAFSVKETITSRCQIVTLRFSHNDRSGPDTETALIRSIIAKNHSNAIDENSIDCNQLVYSAFEFVEKSEQNKIDMILFNNLIFKNYLKDKELLLDVLDAIMLIYKDALNLLANKELNIFSNYLENIKKIATQSNVKTLCKKINVILETKEKIKNNANTVLVLDKLILKLEGAEQYD